jgi:hypothetical protein
VTPPGSALLLSLLFASPSPPPAARCRDRAWVLRESLRTLPLADRCQIAKFLGQHLIFTMSFLRLLDDYLDGDTALLVVLLDSGPGRDEPQRLIQPQGIPTLTGNKSFVESARNRPRVAGDPSFAPNRPASTWPGQWRASGALALRAGARP